MSLRSRKKQQTRDAIIQAARKLFAEHGYDATRTRDIAQAAGIATGTLFNYAKTKEEIVLMVWKSRAHLLMENGFVAAKQESDPVQAMLVIFGPIFEFYGEDVSLGRVFLHHATYAPATDPEIVALNEGFIARIGLVLAPHAGLHALHAALNVFAAYHTVLTMLLGGRLLKAHHATSLLGQLLQVQVDGWN